jgi:hypothetical protein
MKRLLTIFCIGLLVTTALGASPDGLVPYDLRVDGLRDPVGVDADRIYLSWKLESDLRGARQTAWEVEAASSRDKLLSGEADLWRTGKQAGNQQLQIRYRGTRPDPAEGAWWRVRVWNEAGEPGDWSEPATWTEGLRRPSDWEAKWIASKRWLSVERPHLGYRSLPADDPNTEKWIALDLGEIHEIERIRLHGLSHTVPERLGLPVRYVAELATQPDFSDAVIVSDTREQPVNIWSTRHTITVPDIPARYFRLTAPELRDANGEIALAFKQIEISSNGENVARGAVVTASDSLEQGPWAKAAVVDGLGLPGAVPFAAGTVRMRREFQVRTPLERATLFVSGLGQYALWINGEELTTGSLTPGWTQVEKTVLYDTYDLTPFLRMSDNAIALLLAGGMYNVPDPDGRYTKFVSRFNPLMAIAQLHLEYVDGTHEIITTDESWKSAPGAVTYSHVYGGEVFDARHDDNRWTWPVYTEGPDWQAVAVCDGPGGFLRGASHAAPRVEIIEERQPVGTHQLDERTTVYDFGQNASMMVRLAVRGPSGSRVRIEPSELLGEDGRIDPASTRRGLASWDYILKGSISAETWQSRFWYHGARYLQVTVFPEEDGADLPQVEALTGLVTHSTVEPVGNFACSSDLWTRTRSLVRWAQRSNMVSVLTDCPHRERLGWLEQYHLNGPSLRYEFDLQALYRKCFQDMEDAQTAFGLVPNIAPEYIIFPTDFRDSPEWGSALIIASWQQYLFTGDDSAFSQHYNAMQDYVEYLASRADGHILSHGLGDWYDLGPGAPGYAQLTPVGLTATAVYYANAVIMARMAEHRTRYGEAAAYRERAENIRTAFNEKWFDSETGSYATGSQTANAMPYALGMVPEGREEEVFAALVRAIEANDGAVSGGDVGHRYILQSLAKGGRPDLVYAMHHRTDRPGYGWQLERGKTSLTEAWDGGSSQNHFMLGHIMEWFYRHLVGISPDPDEPGFGHILIEPQPVEELEWAEADYHSVRGPVSVRWEREGRALRLSVSIPANTTATVKVPLSGSQEVFLDGAVLAEQAGLLDFKRHDHNMVATIGSGSYEFIAR